MFNLHALKIEENYLQSSIENDSSEIIFNEINNLEQLAKKLVLPLKIKGTFLKVGRPLARFYSEEEIKKGIQNTTVPFPIHNDHRDKETSTMVGTITKIFWDDKEKVAKYVGHINDETSARNVLDGIVNQISATINSVKVFDPEEGLVGKDLSFSEISLVILGAEESNTLLIDKN